MRLPGIWVILKRLVVEKVITPLYTLDGLCDINSMHCTVTARYYYHRQHASQLTSASLRALAASQHAVEDCTTYNKTLKSH